MRGALISNLFFDLNQSSVGNDFGCVGKLRCSAFTRIQPSSKILKTFERKSILKFGLRFFQSKFSKNRKIEIFEKFEFLKNFENVSNSSVINIFSKNPDALESYKSVVSICDE